MTDSIKALYPFALAEGEGVGTAYEYVAKARLVRGLAAKVRRGGRILVAGLPEKYGTSLDFALIAHRAGAELHIVDDRDAALDRARGAIASVHRAGAMEGLRVVYERVPLDALAGLGPHDLVLTCEVLQRIPTERRRAFVGALRSLAPMGGVFAPNSENGSHLAISGLPGLTLRELRDLLPDAELAYLDMPPFPPGIKRTAAQRTQASSGLAEALAMRALDAYCAAERLVPGGVKKHFAHIVAAAWGG